MIFSPMEWIFAGSLPGSARKAHKAREVQRKLDKAQKESARIQEALAAKEGALKSKSGTLQKELHVRTGEALDDASMAERLMRGVSKTRDKLEGGLGRLVSGKQTLDASVLGDVEELLLTADVGPQTTDQLIRALGQRLKRSELNDPSRLKDALKEEIDGVMNRTYAPPNLGGKPPIVILFTGVNGSGKTTTIGKLGANYAAEGKKVLLAAGDTFRAAAAEQLEGWAKRAGCDLFAKEAGASPSGLVYQAVEKGMAEGYDIVLCDTAGRLHTKSNLMEELKKIKRVITKLMPEAPHETYLVLDANNGQNAIHQAREFHDAIGVTGLVITKLDGTARGGVIIGIVNEFEIPVRYIGVGEAVEDLRVFDAKAFSSSLFD